MPPMNKIRERYWELQIIMAILFSSKILIAECKKINKYVTASSQNSLYITLPLLGHSKEDSSQNFNRSEARKKIVSDYLIFF